MQEPKTQAAPYRPPTDSLVHQAIALGVSIVQERGCSPALAGRLAADRAQFRDVLDGAVLGLAIREAMGL